MKTHVVKLDHVVYVREDGKGNHLVCRMMSHHGEDTAHKISHAINQHDKLVAMLRWYDDVSECPACGRVRNRHATNCEIAALLKEEET